MKIRISKYLPIKLYQFYFVVFFISCSNKKENPKIESIKKTDSTTLTINKNDAIRLYLTFDDGPYESTPALTKYLTSRKIKASFFVIGSQISYTKHYDSIFLATKHNELFKTYNHTFSHAVTHGRIKKYYKNPVAVWNDIMMNKKYLPLNCNITRLPGTNAWRYKGYQKCFKESTATLFKYLDSIKSTESIFGWDFEWTLKESNDSINVNKFLLKIVEQISKNKSPKKDYVILLHDYLFKHENSLNNFDYFLSLLKKEINPEFKWAEEYQWIN